MGVVNTKSTLITNAEAASTLSAAALAGCGPRHPIAVVEAAAADSNTSVYRFFRVHSSERLHSLWLKNDANGGGTSYDVGLYDTAENGGSVVDADAFASAITLASASTSAVDVLNEAMNIDQLEKSVWQLPGVVGSLTVDPGKYYDVCMTANVAGSVGGTIVLGGSAMAGRA